MTVHALAGGPGSDHDACAREPIHAPGAVQAHAFWFAVDRSTRQPCGVSVSLCALLGVATEEFLRPEGLDVFDAASRSSIRSRALLRDSSETLRLSLANGLAFDAFAYDTGEVIKFDLEREGDPAVIQSAVTRIGSVIAGLRDAKDIDELIAVMARGVADLTGFDRVMIYRFDADWNGDVVAEVHRGGSSVSYLGLKFPATDIPAQARALFLRNGVRQIPDVASDDSPIVPALNPNTGEPWDLSDSQVRAVAPVHLEYLQNMGVKASLVVALTERGKLWGLVACHHHHGPLALAPRLRSLCSLLCEVFSAQMSLRLAAAHADALDKVNTELKAINRRAQAVASGSGGEGFGSFVAAIGDRLAALVQADSLRVWIDGDVLYVGSTVPTGEIVAMVSAAQALTKRGRSGVLSSDNLRACGCIPGAGAAGFAYARAPSSEGAVMAVRREIVTEETWAGDPNATAIFPDAMGRLHPRRSFDLWREERRERSCAWTETDHEALSLIVDRLWHWRFIFEQARRIALIERLDENRAQVQELAMVAERASAPVVITNIDGVIIWVNEAFSLLYGFIASETIGQRASLLHGPLTDPVEVARFQAARDRCEPIRSTLVNYTRSGDPFWADIQSAPIFDYTGALDRYISIIHDVSDAREREAALQKALARAQESDRLKDEFLNVLSHEIRTPLNGVLGGLAIITAGIEDGPKLAMAEIVKKSALSLLAVFGGMLDLARTRAEAEAPVFSDINPTAFLDEACATIRAAADAKGLIVRIVAPHDLPLLHTDGRLLRQILINLLSNALKFTAQGEIVARIELSDSDDGGVVFSVEDTGPGVPLALRTRIFEPFFQIDGSTTRSVGGAGLGLAICRDFATKLSGEIGVASSPSGGARFWLRLPIGAMA